MAWRKHLSGNFQEGSDGGSSENIQNPTATTLDLLTPAGRFYLKPETRHMKPDCGSLNSES